MGCPNLPYDVIVGNIQNLLPNLAKEVNMTINEEPSFWQELLGVTDHPYQSGTRGYKMSYHGFQTPNPFTHTYAELTGGSIAATDHNPKSSACGYNSQQILGDGADMRGYAMERLVLESPEFCLDEWFYANYADTFLKGKMSSLANYNRAVLENYSFEKIYSIAQKTYVAGDGQFKFLGIGENWPTITDLNVAGGTIISRISGGILKSLYDYMISADAMPVGKLEGNDAFLYIGDAADTSDWQDEEFTSKITANSLPNLVEFVQRYNITDNYRSMFMIAKSSKMPRANIDANGNVVLVWRRQNNMAAQIGVVKGPNAEFNQAAYTLSFVVGKGLGDIVLPSGNEISIDAFKPRPLNLEWRTWQNPLCKLGNKLQFISEDVRGFVAGENPVVYLLLSARKGMAFNAKDFGVPTCIQPPVTCEATTPSGCPCPQLSNMCEGLTPNIVFFDVSPAVTYADEDPISIRTSANTVVTGTIEGAVTDGTRIQVDFGTDIIPAIIQNFYLEIVCEAFGACSSDVSLTSTCLNTAGEATLTVVNKLVALTDGDALTATFCDGFVTDIDYEATGSNLALNQYVVNGDGSDDLDELLCVHGDICHICVVPTVGNGCPGCEVTDTECVEEEEEG